MAEYIEREKLLELINDDCKYSQATNDYQKGCNEVCDWAIKMIKNIPTADVVPKSEVENCIPIDVHEALKQIAKSEVAREIFEEIEKIRAKELHRCETLYEREEDIEQRKFWEGCQYSLHQLTYWFAELKKKYTEEKT